MEQGYSREILSKLNIYTYMSDLANVRQGANRSFISLLEVSSSRKVDPEGHRESK